MLYIVYIILYIITVYIGMYRYIDTAFMTFGLVFMLSYLDTLFLQNVHC